MGDLTLDIAEVQILVHYPHDPTFQWHHRILLHRVEGGTWIALTPDHELQTHNLTNTQHRILDRRAPFPPELAADVYAHDPLGKSQLSAFKRQAKIQAIILGQGELDDSEAVEWVVSEPSHPDFGSAIDMGLLNNGATGVAFSNKGVILREGEEIFVERVLVKDLEDWKRQRGLEGGDTRLLGDHKDESGVRRLELGKAISLMKSADDSDFPIHGARAAKELHESVALGPGNFVSYHAEWIRLSGVAKRTSAAHIHRTLCESLRLLHSYDQIDSSSTAIGEHLSRWLVQTEVAVERNPSQPDYSGLDIISGTSVQGDGRASTSRFTEWLKERAQIWKQERLYNSERRQ